MLAHHCLQESQEGSEINHCCLVAVAAVHGSTLTNVISEAKDIPERLISSLRFAFPCSEAGLPRALNGLCQRKRRHIYVKQRIHCFSLDVSLCDG